MVFYRESVSATSRGNMPTFHDITDEVKEIVARSKAKNGICVVYSHHTTCSVLIQEHSYDETYNEQQFLMQDLLDMFETILPTCRKEGQYLHPGPKITEVAASHGEGKPWCLNTDGHLRSVLLGRSESIVIQDGKLDLGQFGRIYFADFDQTRVRDCEAQVQIIGEAYE